MAKKSKPLSKTTNKKLVRCKACGTEIDPKCNFCFHCGAKNKKSITKKWWFWPAVILLLIGFAGGGSEEIEPTNPTNNIAQTDNISIPAESTPQDAPSPESNEDSTQSQQSSALIDTAKSDSAEITTSEIKPTEEQDQVSTTTVPSDTQQESPQDIPVDSSFEIHYIDVGQADSALVLCDGKAMMVDGGNAADSSLIYSYLKNHGISYLDYVVASHSDEDHVGGLSGALNYASVGTVFSPVTSDDGNAWITTLWWFLLKLE